EPGLSLGGGRERPGDVSLAGAGPEARVASYLVPVVGIRHGPSIRPGPPGSWATTPSLSTPSGGDRTHVRGLAASPETAPLRQEAVPDGVEDGGGKLALRQQRQVLDPLAGADEDCPVGLGVDPGVVDPHQVADHEVD